jgi:hypothetical protein
MTDWRPGHESSADTRARHNRERDVAETSWTTITPDQLRAKLRALDGHPFRGPLISILATAVARHARPLAHLLPPDTTP